MEESNSWNLFSCFLPQHIMDKIFSYADITTLFNCVLVCRYWRDILINFDQPELKSVVDGMHPYQVNQVLLKLKKSKLSKSYVRQRECNREVGDCKCASDMKSYFIDIFRVFPNIHNLVKCMIKRMISKMIRCKELLVFTDMDDEAKYVLPYENTLKSSIGKIKEFKSIWHQAFFGEDSFDDDRIDKDFYIILFNNCERKQLESFHLFLEDSNDPDTVNEEYGISRCSSNCRIYIPLSENVIITRTLVNEIFNRSFCY